MKVAFQSACVNNPDYTCRTGGGASYPEALGSSMRSGKELLK